MKQEKTITEKIKLKGRVECFCEYTMNFFELENGLLVGSGKNNSIKTWNKNQSNPIESFGETEDYLRTAILLPNNKIVAIYRENLVRIYDLITHACLKEWKENDEFIQYFATKDGRLVSYLGASLFKIYGMNTFECDKSIPIDPNEAFTQIIELSNGQLASCQKGSVFKIWDLTTYSCVATVTNNKDSGMELFELSNNRLALCKNMDIQIWSIGTQKCLGKFKTEFNGDYGILMELPNNRLLVASEDINMQIWDIQSFTKVALLQGHVDHIYDVVLSIDKNNLVSLEDKNIIKVWDANTYQCTSTIELGETEWVKMLKVLKTGEIASTAEGSVILWEITDK